MELGGRWAAALADDELRRAFPERDLDESSWEAVSVPGHWRTTPAFAGSDGPVLYRKAFEAPVPAERQRAWLHFDGIFYQADVWLDGSYVGDTEGYFFRHTFEVTDALRQASEHLLAVEVACYPPSDRTAKRNLTGVFQHWDCTDPSWNPGGIWAPVHVGLTGPVRIESLRVACPEATAERATVDLYARLDAPDARVAAVTTTVTDPSGSVVATRTEDQTLAAGTNHVRWRVQVDDPRLWWPHALGDQPLYDLHVAVTEGGNASNGSTATKTSDEWRVRTGLRQIRMRNFIASINGERIFLKGTNLGPTRLALGDASPGELADDVYRAKAAGLDLIRMHAHIGRPETYRAADETGMLVWQDLPLQWGYAGVRKQAMRQARRAVARLGHHPSIIAWCAHNDPRRVDRIPYEGGRLRGAAGRLLPNWNRTVLDQSVKRSLDRADGSRPVVAHSGVVPHPAWGTDTHSYLGWYHGHERDFPAAMSRLPVMARFVSEFGAQAVPESDGFMEPERWPDLDWKRLGAAHGLQLEHLDRYVTRTTAYATWKAATQAYQADVVRYHIETLRRLKYRPTGGFCQYLLADAQPAVTWALLDHQRVPKAGWAALVAACAPVVVIADRPDPWYLPGDRIRLDVHAVSDLRTSLPTVTATATLSWPGGSRRWEFEGNVAADSCVRIGRIDQVLPPATAPGPVRIELALEWPDQTGQPVSSTYTSRVRNETVNE